MAIDQINREVFNIWEKHCNPCDDILVPLMYYPPLKTDGLLFIGINPSFTPESYADVGKEFFHWSNRTNFDLEKDAAIEKNNRRDLSYFRKFKEIAEYVNLNWESIDLLFWRETILARLIHELK